MNKRNSTAGRQKTSRSSRSSRFSRGDRYAKDDRFTRDGRSSRSKRSYGKQTNDRQGDDKARYDKARYDKARYDRRNNPSMETPLREVPDKGDNYLIGRNPVIEALKAEREIEHIYTAKGSEGSIKQIHAMAKEQGIPVDSFERNIINDMAPGEKHQGVIATVSSYEYATIDDVFKAADESGEPPFIIILDEISDPHNLGAIIRSAECAGAHGVIIPKRRACGLTETVGKTSAGAVETMNCVKVTNIGNTIDLLKEKGLWIAACDMDGEKYYKANLSGPIALVIGAEGKGIGRLVKEKCDFTVSIPMKGKINSLNASNAAAILMYEIRRRREEV